MSTGRSLLPRVFIVVVKFSSLDQTQHISDHMSSIDKPEMNPHSKGLVAVVCQTNNMIASSER